MTIGSPPVLVDANIPLYAEDVGSPFHKQAKQWWDGRLSGSDPVCLSWDVINAFIRIGTNPRVFDRPLTVQEAVKRVQSWLEQPCIRLIHPTERHWEFFQTMLTATQATANLVPDAHLAALSLEHGCEIRSTDGDFARFPRVKWKNPIVP